MTFAILIEQRSNDHLLFSSGAAFAAGLTLLFAAAAFGFIDRQKRRKNQRQGYSRGLWLLLGSGVGLIILSVVIDHFYPGLPFQHF
jgi:cytochrome c biogenesis protein CcdA